MAKAKSGCPSQETAFHNNQKGFTLTIWPKKKFFLESQSNDAKVLPHKVFRNPQIWLNLQHGKEEASTGTEHARKSRPAARLLCAMFVRNSGMPCQSRH